MVPSSSNFYEVVIMRMVSTSVGDHLEIKEPISEELQII